MASEIYDLVIIGAGPGGEVGAIRARQLGLKTAVVEKNEHLGGTCLNVGCIPTKALIESAKNWSKLQKLADQGFAFSKPTFDWTKILARKDEVVNAQRKGLKFLFKKNQIDLFGGTGSLKSKDTVFVSSADGNSKTLTARHILLATGSRVRQLPFAKIDGQNIHSSDTILNIDHIPESLGIIGGGVIGMEFATLFAQFGCQVTVFEAAPQILPNEDAEVVKELSQYIRKWAIKIHTEVRVKSIESSKKGVQVHLEGSTTPNEEGKPFAKLLIAIGREPVSDGLGLETLGIRLEKGFIPVDRHYRSSIPNVFAIGDLIGTPALAHTASAEALHAVEIIAGKTPHPIDYETNPSAIYTYPEVASIGRTEARLKAEGRPYQVAKFPFAPLAKAKIEDTTVGFIKILYEPQYREILGVHIVGAKATELIAEFSLAKVLEGTVDEIAHTIHPHPTLSETVMEAAHVAMGGAIHL